jgi:hypothetical protein
VLPKGSIDSQPFGGCNGLDAREGAVAIKIEKGEGRPSLHVLSVFLNPLSHHAGQAEL